MNHKPEYRPRIVLADDNDQILTFALMLLSAEFDVITAVHNGEEAIEAVNRLKPDVLVLDIEMPVLDGLRAAKRLIADGALTKIVFLTGLEDPEHVEYARSMGASAFVFKAYILNDLPRAISEALAGRFFSSFGERE